MAKRVRAQRRTIKPIPLEPVDESRPRSYSNAFPTTSSGRHQLSIDRIPTDLYKRIKEKSKREGIALRSLILEFLDRWSRR